MKKIMIAGSNLLSKARNLFAKAVGAPAIKPAEDKKPFARIANDITKYIYLNPGLNRSERNHLFAKIKKNRHWKRGIGNKGDFETAQAILKATPKNIPATHARIVENSRLKAAGEPIKVFSR